MEGAKSTGAHPKKLLYVSQTSGGEAEERVGWPSFY